MLSRFFLLVFLRNLEISDFFRNKKNKENNIRAAARILFSSKTGKEKQKDKENGIRAAARIPFSSKTGK